METTTQATQPIYDLLATVPDPEVPVLSVLDLGVVREVAWLSDGTLEVTITPTYAGCPAMDVFSINIRSVLQENGYDKVAIKTVLSPAWTTKWLSPEGREKLRAYGIAPPEEEDESADKHQLFAPQKVVPCPLCQATNTRLVSQFGSTACKAHYQCLACLEPFDYFKCH